MTMLSSRISGCEYGQTPQCRNKAGINIDKTLEEADKKIYKKKWHHDDEEDDGPKLGW